MKTVLIIPAQDEEASIGDVLDEIPGGVYAGIFVVDNGSRDRTAEVASGRGATVLSEPRRGYGNACLRGMAEIPEDAEVVVFMDGDGSDDPGEVRLLLEPIEKGEADFVVGSRQLGVAEPGSLSPHQSFGNRLVTWLSRVLCGTSYTDLGPFRALRAESLKALEMADRNYGWTVEMQMKAWRDGLRVQEVPVRYRRRQRGVSKVSGSVVGSMRAGVKILWTFFRIAFAGRKRRP
jgi:glycosyltransferase involved in cell wall biosynthesis